MACIKLKSQWGERHIPEGTPYQRLKGEEIVGTLWNCGPNEVATDEVERELEKAGVKWGDAVAWVTKKFGIQQCSRCKARQEIMNHASELGFAETMKQIKETFK